MDVRPNWMLFKEFDVISDRIKVTLGMRMVHVAIWRKT